MSRLCALLLLCPIAVGCNDVRSMRRARDVSGLVAALSSSDPVVRVKAADALGAVGDGRAVRPLIRALEDPDPYVREHAARNLGCDQHSTSERSYLGCDTAEARGPLVRVLDDPDEMVRLEAVRSLGELRDTAAVAPLEEVVRSDSSPDVRREGIIALGELGDDRVRPLLESFQSSDDALMREAAEEALGRLATSRRRSQEDLEIEVQPSPGEERDEGNEGASTDGGTAGSASAEAGTRTVRL